MYFVFYIVVLISVAAGLLIYCPFLTLHVPIFICVCICIVWYLSCTEYMYSLHSFGLGLLLYFNQQHGAAERIHKAYKTINSYQKFELNIKYIQPPTVPS